jgi:hypothetical protein
MIDTPAPTTRKGYRGFYLAGRFLLGYIVAIAAGALVFALVESVFPDGVIVNASDDINVLSRQIWQLWVFCFIFGGVFALPYTVVGALVFKFLLPHNWIVFTIVGVLCPTIAIMTLNVFLGGGWPISSDLPQMALASLPAGIVATYLFGAISFGLGFRRWRFS